MTMIPETMAERAEVARDLQLAARQALGAGDERREWTVEDASPRRMKWKLYNKSNGAPIEVPEFLGKTAIQKRDPRTGEPMFTAFKEQAPEFKPGTVKCFLHPESAERPVLDAIGITSVCPKATLVNLHGKQTHAKGLHKAEWAAYQEHIKTEEAREQRSQQQAQIDATLRLAEAATGNGRRGRQET